MRTKVRQLSLEITGINKGCIKNILLVVDFEELGPEVSIDFNQLLNNIIIYHLRGEKLI
jgi:hypothetical protein